MTNLTTVLDFSVFGQSHGHGDSDPVIREKTLTKVEIIIKEEDRVVKNYEFVFRCRFVVLVLFYHIVLFREQTVSTFLHRLVTNTQDCFEIEIRKNVFSHLKECVLKSDFVLGVGGGRPV